MTMERSIQVQAQIRRDAEEHGRALRALQGWGEEMKRRAEEMRESEKRRQEREDKEKMEKEAREREEARKAQGW